MEEHDLIRDMLTREPSFEPLKRLPGQPESNDYFEVLDARPIPDGFFGYVGEYSGERFEDGAKSVRAVALVKQNGDV